MQRWFFLEDSENAVLRGTKADAISGSAISLRPKKWRFQVRLPEILASETVCVTGSDASLGNWLPEQCVPLAQDPGDNDLWSGTVTIGDDAEVAYRYCVCMLVEPGAQVMVRRWETHVKPRRIRAGARQDGTDEPDTFGHYDGTTRVDSGWLTQESVVHLKLYNNPLTLWRPKYASRTVHIKVTPVNLVHNTTDKPTTMADLLEESLSTDTQDQAEPPKYAHTVVASLTASNEFQPQGQFGKEYHPHDILVFETSVLDLKNIAFLIDLYVYRTHGSMGSEPPHHVGFSYLLPSALKSSEGHTVLPVTSTKHRPMGQIELNYVVVRPLSGYRCDMRVSYARHWNKRRQGLDVGHRGLGTSFKAETKNCAEVRENTVASLKTAVSHGADFVEFDVQLSKDLVPVIYHDFHVCIAMKRKKSLDYADMLELPVKELTLEQLHFLKVYHVLEGKTKNPRFFDEDLEEHQPFPTLQQVLEVIDPHVGFNVEIKWSNQLSDGSQELENSLDINLYLDTILDVVLRYAGERRIIFSCFNADACRLIRLKQNKYPVMFLTQGQTAKYPNYRDPRCQTIEAAVQHAVCTELLGVNVHTEDLLRDNSQVRLAKEAGLVIFCWGDDNNDPATIKHLKELGLHAVIYDKIDQYSSKEVKESIFLVEARESQRQLLLLAAANAESPSSPKAAHELERARKDFMDMSTSSGGSLDSRVADARAALPQPTSARDNRTLPCTCKKSTKKVTT